MTIEPTARAGNRDFHAGTRAVPIVAMGSVGLTLPDFPSGPILTVLVGCGIIFVLAVLGQALFSGSATREAEWALRWMPHIAVGCLVIICFWTSAGSRGSVGIPVEREVCLAQPLLFLAVFALMCYGAAAVRSGLSVQAVRVSDDERVLGVVQA